MLWKHTDKIIMSLEINKKSESVDGEKMSLDQERSSYGQHFEEKFRKDRVASKEQVTMLWSSMKTRGVSICFNVSNHIICACWSNSQLILAHFEQSDPIHWSRINPEILERHGHIIFSCHHICVALSDSIWLFLHYRKIICFNTNIVLVGSWEYKSIKGWENAYAIDITKVKKKMLTEWRSWSKLSPEKMSFLSLPMIKTSLMSLGNTELHTQTERETLDRK